MTRLRSYAQIMTLFREQPELLIRFRAGEAPALHAVYERYCDLVSVVVKRGVFLDGRLLSGAMHRQDWRDLVHACFARAFSESARKSYDGMREYKPYLLTLCRNVIIDWAKKHRHDRLATSLEQGDMNAVAAPEAFENDPWLDPTLVALTTRYVESLPTDLAAVHQQRYVLCATQDVAAQTLGLSRQQLRTQENRLREGVRKFLRAQQTNPQPNAATRSIDPDRTDAGRREPT